MFQALFSNASAPALAVAGAANNGSGLIRITVASTSKLSTGQKVLIQNVHGATEANGKWTVTVIDGSHFDLQGSTFANAYTSDGVVVTTTVNVSRRGAKFLSKFQTVFGSTRSGTISAASFNTCVYDGLLDLVFCNPGGIPNPRPLSFHAALANILNKPLWFSLPILINDSSVTRITQYLCSHLDNDVYEEWGNEPWNYAFPVGQIATQRGLALGFPLSSNNAQYSYIGLRNRQVWGVAKSACPSNKLHTISSFQAFGAPSQFDRFALQGQSLTGVGNPKYQSIIGVNYNSAPNRPIDFQSAISGKLLQGLPDRLYRQDTFADY